MCGVREQDISSSAHIATAKPASDGQTSKQVTVASSTTPMERYGGLQSVPYSRKVTFENIDLPFFIEHQIGVLLLWLKRGREWRIFEKTLPAISLLFLSTYLLPLSLYLCVNFFHSYFLPFIFPSLSRYLSTLFILLLDLRLHLFLSVPNDKHIFLYFCRELLKMLDGRDSNPGSLV